ncbi:hypothetical protein ACI2T7_03490 [Ralstonia nicotianae]
MAKLATPYELQVCEDILADDSYCNDEGYDPQPYAAKLAEFVRRDDISDAEKVRTFDALLDQLFRDIKNAAIEKEQAADALIAEDEARDRLARKLGMGLAA